jgi:SAM-dependent methyltransferase
MNRYLRANKFNWEQKALINFRSAYYDVDAFRRGKSSLRPLELSALGDVKGKSLLHLQCHFGMDTLSWSRRGAKVVGVDFSEVAIVNARLLSKETGVPARFIQSDIYDLRKRLTGKFDIVFVSYGCLGWLPDLEKWAEIVAHYLKPGGTFFIVDFHPLYWMFDLVAQDSRIIYPYESGKKPFEFPPSPYADPKAKIKGKEYWWNHGMAKIINSLIRAGLSIECLREAPVSVLKSGDSLAGIMKWVKKDLGNKVPVFFAITARKHARGASNKI